MTYAGTSFIAVLNGCVISHTDTLFLAHVPKVNETFTHTHF